MTEKLPGFTNFIGWLSMLVGSFIIAFSLFGLFLMSGRGGSTPFGYAPPINFLLGVTIIWSGYLLLKEDMASQYFFLVACVLSLFAEYKFFVLMPSLFTLSWPLVAFSFIYSFKWFFFSLISAYVAHRRFRNAS